MTKTETETDKNLRRRVGDMTNKEEASFKARAETLQSAILGISD